MPRVAVPATPRTPEASSPDRSRAAGRCPATILAVVLGGLLLALAPTRAAVAATSPARSVVARSPAMDLHVSSRGPAVLTLERRLEVLRLLPPRQVDRTYNRTTASSVRAFQRTHALPVTGRVTTRTWRSLAREAARRSTPTPAPAPAAPAPPAPLPAPTGPPPTVVGHRGARVAGIGENTMASMRYATPYAAVLEFDLQFTSDDVAVLVHDATLDRTTTCTGPVSALTAAEVTRCHVEGGSPEETVPTLEEVAAYAESTGRAVSPELKSDTVTDGEIGSVLGILAQHALTDRTYLQSFFPQVLTRVHATSPGMHLVYLVSGSTNPLPQTVSATGADIVGIYITRTDAPGVAAYHRAGLRVWSWTASTVDQLNDVWRSGADGVFTDVPQAAHALYPAAS